MAKRNTGKHAQPKASVKHSKKKSKKDAQENSLQANNAANSVVADSTEAQTPVTDPMTGQPFQGTAPMAAAPMAGQQVTIMSATELLQKKRAKRRKTFKWVGIASLSVVGAIAAVYFAGVIVFSTYFMPNTHISDIDLSMKTSADLRTDFDEKVGNYSFKVKGEGLNLEVTSADADVKVDTDAMAKELLDGQDAWTWPIEVFKDHDATERLTSFVQADKLSDLIQAQVKEINANATSPTNAYCEFDTLQNKYAIVPEKLGTKLEYDSVMAHVLLGVMALDNLIVLDSADLVQPEVKSTDERLINVAAEANAIAAADMQLMMDGNQIGTVTGADVSKWITITKKYKAKLDEEAMKQWATELAESLNTVGAERTYTRADGKKCTVSGGDYGWSVDSATLTSRLVEGIKKGKQGKVEVPVLQKGSGFTAIGEKDWGNRYIDVDISQQKAVFYGDDGKVIWESAVVTGLPTAARATPQGVFDINLKGTNVKLIGRNSKGKKTYETPVQYWMPFKDNAVGFHDANWQPTFGGSRYLYGGSHGCVNLPPAKAAELYEIIQVGDVVVVHE